jgi:hypothetical protein
VIVLVLSLVIETGNLGDLRPVFGVVAIIDRVVALNGAG